MNDFLTVSELARQFNCSPRVISDAFYKRRIPDGEIRCPVIAGRRLIPRDFIEVIRTAVLLPATNRKVAELVGGAR